MIGMVLISQILTQTRGIVHVHEKDSLRLYVTMSLSQPMVNGDIAGIVLKLYVNTESWCANKLMYGCISGLVAVENVSNLSDEKKFDQSEGEQQYRSYFH